MAKLIKLCYLMLMSQIALTYMLKRIGPQTVPCGTLYSRVHSELIMPSIFTTCFLSLRYLSINFSDVSRKPTFSSVWRGFVWLTVSKALAKSTKMKRHGLLSYITDFSSQVLYCIFCWFWLLETLLFIRRNIIFVKEAIGSPFQ